ncbi:porin [Microvirga aerilata]|uniref:Porin n=1 Tax=Microvirga aerilata TaxID=670292 RepID=A0A936Z7G5_9HYPH|nr:porin [Microvirga aerilata]MBL0404706.1 porin [Microvirga aerilata]
MKLAKSLFLGSVAGLAAVAGAQAADLPVAKAAAVEYVRVCSTYGAGFFYIPGTETCLKVGGRVRAEYQYLEPQFREDASIGFRARARVALDARTATAYGLLRTYIRMEMDRNTGVYNGQAGGFGTSPNIAQAYIQFGGLTAGRTTSFFTNGDIPNENITTLRFYDYPDVNLLAYTFSFGNGFSATLSLEEGAFAGNRLTGPSAFDPTVSVAAGQRWPDLVGNVKYAGTWGSVQLSGALHQTRSNVLVDGDFEDDFSDELGWSVGVMGHFNLPALGAGDALWFSAAYADGALGYLGFGSNVTGVGLSGATGTVRSVPVVDAYLDVDGDIEKGRGWQVAGGLRHYWTPTVRSNVHGSYASVEYSGGTLLSDFDEWRVGVNTFWTPVSGLNIGVEVLYANIDVQGVELEAEDRWEGRLRIQRDF